MKRIALLLTILLSITFLSCENEPLEGDFYTETPDTGNENPGSGGENPGSGNNDDYSLVGDWTTTDFSATIVSQMEGAGVSFETVVEVESISLDYDITFLESNIYETSGAYGLMVSITLNGEELENYEDAYSGVTSTGDYSVEGNILTVDGSFFSFEAGDENYYGEGEAQSMQISFSNNGNTVTLTQNEETVETEAGVETIVTINSVTILQRL